MKTFLRPGQLRIWAAPEGLTTIGLSTGIGCAPHRLGRNLTLFKEQI